MSTWIFTQNDDGFTINIDGGPLFWREGATVEQVMTNEGITEFTITTRHEDGEQYWDVEVNDIDALIALEDAGRQWQEARDSERDLAAQVYAAIQRASAVGFNEVQIAKHAGCDRMTVRRALGKL